MPRDHVKYRVTLLVWSLQPQSPPCKVSRLWALWKRRYNVFLSRDHYVEESRDLFGVVPLFRGTTLLSLRSIGLMEVEVMAFISSNSSSSAKAPMARFTNGLPKCKLMSFFFSWVQLWFILYADWQKYAFFWINTINIIKCSQSMLAT